MTTSPYSQPEQPEFNWSALIQLVLSALAALFLLGAAAIIALVTTTRSFSSSAVSPDTTQSLMIAASLAFAGFLVLPSAWFAAVRLFNPQKVYITRPEKRSFGLIFTLLVILLVGGSVLLGNWSTQNNQLTWLLLPLLNLVATGLPALWLIYIGTRSLIPGAPSRRWGVFATGLVVGPMIILVLELILLIGMAVLAILWASLDSSLSGQLNNLVFRLENGAPNMDAILRILQPFIFNPGILVIGFTFISLLVPLLEEALKPIGVWLLAGQKLTPAQGFGYGVLSGAGFGLFENLGNATNAGDTWALLVSARISTLLLHSFTAGLVGWAMISAWRNRRYLLLFVAYFGAVIIHGLWNGLAVLSAIASLPNTNSVWPSINLEQLTTISSLGIVGIGALVLILFVSFNVYLRRNLGSTPHPHPSQSSPPDYPAEQGRLPIQPGSQPPSDSVPPSTFPPGDAPSANPDPNSSVSAGDLPHYPD